MLVHFTFFTLFRYPFLSWTLTSSFSVTFGHIEKVFRSILKQFHSFMFTLVMLLQNTCCSCGVFTFNIRISHTFMFTLVILLQNFFVRSRDQIISLCSGKSVGRQTKMVLDWILCQHPILTLILL